VPGVTVVHSDGRLLIDADRAALDGWVLRLGRDGIAIRELVTDRSPLVGLFLSLTSGGAA
jgi:ABC-2 type transport system ATP-binding protein